MTSTVEVTGEHNKVQETLQVLKDLCLIDWKFMLDSSGKEPVDAKIEQYFTTTLEDMSTLLVVDDGHVVDFEIFIQLPFAAAKTQTERMSAKQRIEYLEKLDVRIVSLYEQARLYSAGEGVSRDDMLTHKEFMSLLGKIKHSEVLQNWLFGIY